ncbi:hypothetical protein IF2G_05281 [Cordyceps javanica]|nr:hypothetical protein IF2G_05281 [Cordyceps javanica]
MMVCVVIQDLAGNRVPRSKFGWPWWAMEVGTDATTTEGGTRKRDGGPHGHLTLVPPPPFSSSSVQEERRALANKGADLQLGSGSTQ